MIGKTPVLLDLFSSGNLIASEVDFLGITTSSFSSEYLMNNTEFVADGKRTKGYSQSQQRLFGNSVCWRKYMPHQKSKRYGKCGFKYESWEWAGSSAAKAWELSLGLDMINHGKFGDEDYQPAIPRATRLDVAYDYVCAEHETTTFLAELMFKQFEQYNRNVAAHNRRQKFKKYHMKKIKNPWVKPEVSGALGELTYYLPRRTGPARFVRIYRKDIQNPEYCDVYGVKYIMRIEVVLKEDWALKAWNARKDGGHFSVAAYAAAELTGIRLEYRSRKELLSPEEVADEAQRMFNMCQQYKAVVPMWDELGMDWNNVMTRLNVAQSKASRSKIKKRHKYIKAVGPDKVMARVNVLVDEYLMQSGAGAHTKVVKALEKPHLNYPDNDL